MIYHQLVTIAIGYFALDVHELDATISRPPAPPQTLGLCCSRGNLLRLLFCKRLTLGF